MLTNYCHQIFFSFFQMRKKLENLASFREHIRAHAKDKKRPDCKVTNLVF